MSYMMPKYDTPFLTMAAQNIEQGLERRGANRQRQEMGMLAGKANMGDQMALQELYMYSPEMASKIQSSQEQAAKDRQQAAMAQQEKIRGRKIEFQKLAREILPQAAKIKDPAQAAQFFNQQLSPFEDLYDVERIGMEYTPEFHQQNIAAHSEAATGPFEGTGLSAQAWNIVLDESKRGTPEFKAAKATLQQPRYIQTDQGTMVIKGHDVEDIIGGKAPLPLEAQGEVSVSEEVVTEEGPTAEIVKGTEKEKKYTQDEARAYGFAARMLQAQNEIDQLPEDYNPASLMEAGRLPVGQTLANMIASEEYQKYEQAKRNWITANLRKESGAVIGVEEMEQEEIKYFPQVGDSRDVIEQKARARKAAEESMIKASARTAEDIRSAAKIGSQKGPKEGEIINHPEYGRLVRRGGKWQKLNP